MASLITKPSSRYTSFDTRSSTSSHQSDFSSPSDLNTPAASRHRPPSDPNPMSGNSSRALSRTKSSDLSRARTEQNFSSMVKKFMEKRSKSKTDRTALIIPDFIAEDMKKNGPKGSNFSALPKKLFQRATSSSGKKERPSETKALTEVKANTRTLAMVLRSERDLLSQNKQNQTLIRELQMLLEEKNTEVEKLKDLCLRQREEIKELKTAILFPDVSSLELHELLEKQGLELEQAKMVIPALQKQVTTLTGQLQSLAEDLAEVKADKYVSNTCFDGHLSPLRAAKTEESFANSHEFNFEDLMTPTGSPDDMFLNDLNPCLTPCYGKNKLKKYEEMGDDSLHGGGLSGISTEIWLESSSARSLQSSKVWDPCQRRHSVGDAATGVVVDLKSDESGCIGTKLVY